MKIKQYYLGETDVIGMHWDSDRKEFVVELRLPAEIAALLLIDDAVVMTYPGANS